MEIIQLKNIYKSYGFQNIINDLSLNVYSKELLAIIGDNGAGKSTLLNIISLILPPDSGKIIFYDKEINWKSDRERDQYRREKIGVITQDFALIYDKTVFDNIALSLHALKYPKNKIRSKVEAILDIMEIKHLSNKYPHELSGGESQKTAIARALVKEPEIILADEPTASLDSSSRKEILCLLKKLTHQGMAIVLVSHDKEAVQYADRVIKL